LTSEKPQNFRASRESNTSVRSITTARMMGALGAGDAV
jgi:hypothetical protein